MGSRMDLPIFKGQDLPVPILFGAGFFVFGAGGGAWRGVAGKDVANAAATL